MPAKVCWSGTLFGFGASSLSEHYYFFDFGCTDKKKRAAFAALLQIFRSLCLEWGERGDLGNQFTAFCAGHRNHALFAQVAVLTARPVAHEFGDEFTNAGDGVQMRVLDVEIQWPGYRIAAVRDSIERGSDAVDDGALHLVGVLIQKAESEYAECVRVGNQFLNDEVVVFTGFDVVAVLAY